jgi:hypothetical protein
MAYKYGDEKALWSGWRYVHNENVHVQKDGTVEQLIILNSQNQVIGNLSNILTPHPCPNDKYLQFLNKENLQEFQNLKYGLSANFCPKTFKKYEVHNYKPCSLMQI